MSDTPGAGLAPTIEGQIKTIDEQAFAEVAHQREGEIQARTATLDPVLEAQGFELADIEKLGPERAAALLARFSATPAVPAKAAAPAPTIEAPDPLAALQSKLADKLGAAGARDVVAILAPLVQKHIGDARTALSATYPELQNDAAWNAVMKLGGDPGATAKMLYGARSRPLNTSENTARRTSSVANGKVTAEDKLWRGYAALIQSNGDMKEAYAAMEGN